MKNCFELYYTATDPNMKYVDLVNWKVALSILFHTIAYVIIYMILCMFFLGKTLPLGNFPYYLALLMIAGYFGRLYRAKSIYDSFLKMGYMKYDALEKTRDYMRTAYFTFYFMG